MRLCILSLSVMVFGLSSPMIAAEPVDFTRSIQPLLSEHCYSCHGPDEKTRKADLRLDTQDGLRSVVVAGQPAKSELITRIKTTEASELMPPQKVNKPLNAQQIQLLQTWVEQGAQWNQHWSFVPPKKIASLPAGSNPIDHFIRERLKSEGLKPNPDAERARWLRRVTFDLTGLPPTPKDVSAFLSDKSDKAYETVVDRLLASPRFGEHMARFWLDYARYGDTHGLHLDNYREIWPFRDWVIRSFNQNKRFDQFLLEQLAGDLIPNATVDQKLGTGFLRCGITTSEGGSIEEECYVRNVVDIVDTVGTVMLGLTTGCARCHDHKYDPISQKDYYSLFAYFNSIEGSALDGNAARHAPILSVPSPEQEQKQAELNARLTAVNEKIAKAITQFELKDETTAASTAKSTKKTLVWIDDALPASGKALSDAGFNTKWQFVAETVHKPHAGKSSVQLIAQGLKQVVLTEVTPGLRVGEGDTLFAHVWIDPKNPPKEIMLQWYTTGWLHRAYWGENRIDWGKDRTAERRPKGSLPEAGKWVKLEVPTALVGIAPGSVINGLAFTQFDGTVYWDSAGIETSAPQGDRRFETLADWSQASAADTSVPKAIRDIIKLNADKRTDAQKKQLREHFIQYGYTVSRNVFEPLHQELTTITGALKKLEGEIPSSYIFKERASPRPAFILKRGEYDQRGPTVSRATPTALSPANTTAIKDRLALAQWLIDPNHPLTTRVAVNRFWQQVFGTGLVKTADDFGTQGERPSHPQLLDWLAVDFREKGWDVKDFMKSLVLSATYRQSSKLTPELLAKDPNNRLLARGPRYRLDAEMVRDQALFASGLLVETFGGPSVKPPQPAGLWEAVGYTSSNTARFLADREAEKIHRRSLYTFWKRTSPPPQMTALDAPSREACTVRRERTNTPLQALLLMNETQFMEAARNIAMRAMKEQPDQPIAHLFLLVLSRPATEREIEILTKAHGQYFEIYSNDPKSAQQLIANADPKIDAAQLAAMTMVANTILNLDEALTK